MSSIEQKDIKEYSLIDVSAATLDLKDQIIQLLREKIDFLEAKIAFLENQKDNEVSKDNNKETPKTRLRIRTASQLATFLEERSKRQVAKIKEVDEAS